MKFGQEPCVQCEWTFGAVEEHSYLIFRVAVSENDAVPARQSRAGRRQDGYTTPLRQVARINGPRSRRQPSNF